MIRKRLMVMTMVFITAFLFVGCESSNVNKSSAASFVTDNEMNVNMLASNMVPFSGTEADGNITDSIKTKVSNGTVDFTSLTYSDDTVNVGDVVYVEGVIPQKDYPANKIYVYSEPEGNVSFENAILTNKDGNTVVTLDVLGDETGSATVFLELEDSEKRYSFDLDITEAYTRAMPNSYTVYCTPTGGKYHSSGCSYLRGNGIAISVDEALSKGLGPCSRCHP